MGESSCERRREGGGEASKFPEGQPCFCSISLPPVQPDPSRPLTALMREYPGSPGEVRFPDQDVVGEVGRLVQDRYASFRQWRRDMAQMGRVLYQRSLHRRTTMGGMAPASLTIVVGISAISRRNLEHAPGGADLQPIVCHVGPAAIDKIGSSEHSKLILA